MQKHWQWFIAVVVGLFLVAALPSSADEQNLAYQTDASDSPAYVLVDDNDTEQPDSSITDSLASFPAVSLTNTVRLAHQPLSVFTITTGNRSPPVSL